MSWWDDDWKVRKRKNQHGNWDEIFERLLEAIKGMHHDFERMPEFPEQTHPFLNDVKAEADDKHINKLSPFVYGFKYTIGPDRKPQFREFGNMLPSPLGAIPHESREPLIDIMEGHDVLRIIAEIPGIQKEDINLKTTGKTMLITAQRGEYKYQKKLSLPCEVQPETAKAQYNNGVLEIIIKVRYPKGEEFSGHDVHIT